MSFIDFLSRFIFKKQSSDHQNEFSLIQFDAIDIAFFSIYTAHKNIISTDCSTLELLYLKGWLLSLKLLVELWNFSVYF